MLNIIGLILLWILRIIGFILGLIIFLLLLILFVPFRYDAKGSFDEKVKVNVKFSWLLRIFNGKFTLDDQGQNIAVRIFFFKVYPGKVKKEKPNKKKEKLNKKKNKNKKSKDKSDKLPAIAAKSENKESSITIKDVSQDSIESLGDDLNEAVEENTSEEALGQEVIVKEGASVTQSPDSQLIKEEESGPSEPNPLEDGKNKKSTNTKDKKEKKPKKAKKAKKEKKEKEPNQNIEKAKELWAFLQEAENEGVLKFITKYLVKIIKWVLPKKVHADMELGLEDPALTGYIAAVTSIVYVVTKKNIHIVPNFNEQMVKGDFRVKGRLYLYQLLYYIIRVIIDKRVRRLIKKVK